MMHSNTNKYPVLGKIRNWLVEASEEDNCGATDEGAEMYKQCAKDLLAKFDADFPGIKEEDHARPEQSPGGPTETS